MYDQQAWNKAYAYGRLEEAFRLATWVLKEKGQRIPVFPYFRHLYEGKPLEFDYLTDVRNHWFFCACVCVKFYSQTFFNIKTKGAELRVEVLSQWLTNMNSYNIFPLQKKEILKRSFYFYHWERAKTNNFIVKSVLEKPALP